MKIERKKYTVQALTFIESAETCKNKEDESQTHRIHFDFGDGYNTQMT